MQLLVNQTCVVLLNDVFLSDKMVYVGGNGDCSMLVVIVLVANAFVAIFLIRVLVFFTLGSAVVVFVVKKFGGCVGVFFWLPPLEVL